MCGIIGIHFKNPKDTGVQHAKLEKFVDELLLGIEHRGRDATGLLTVDAKGVPNLVKADTEASKFIYWRDPIPKRVQTILGHTRLSTQGSPTVLENDHPIQYETCFAIHNGHISNDSELFKKHSLGRIAEVDSEIIPALFHKYGLDKAHLALQELEGNMATAVVDPDRFPGLTVLAKGWSSPVEVWESKHAVVWASTQTALQEACEKAFGFRPSASKIKSLSLGDILYMEGDKIEKLEFEPAEYYTRRYSGSSSYSFYSSGTSYYNTRTGTQGSNSMLYDECKSCRCKRLWHGSAGDYTGRCMNKIELSVGGFWTCRCEAFVPQEKAEDKETAPAWEYCDGCGRQLPVGDLKAVGKYFFCPTSCARELFPTGPTSEQLRKSAEAIVAAQIAAAEEFAEGDEWSNAAWSARDEATHAETLTYASRRCGLTTKFLDWILFKAPLEIFDADATGYLALAHKMAADAYKDVEKELLAETTDIDISRYAAGDVTVGPCPVGKEGCDGTSCEDCFSPGEEVCGVVVEMEAWKHREEMMA